jgi:TrmH family RNA methyltransferase
MKSWKDNVHFLLVEPKEAGNIGASARAIKNMGFRNLRLVNPPFFKTDEALWFAHGAHDILKSAKGYTTVRDAISDISIIAGTSRRTGRKRGIFTSAEQGVQRLCDIARTNKVAILFGREDRGLFNEEVGECGFLMTIPSSKKQPSLNLAHAVLVIAYELSKAEYIEEQTPFPKLVSQKELASLYRRIGETLTLLDYVPVGDKNLDRKVIQNLKHYIGRSGLTDWELKMFHGICSRIEKKLSSPSDS